MNSNTTRRIHYSINDFEVELEIDTSILDEATAHEINNFLSSAEDRLETCNGDIYRVVGRMFAEGAFGYMAEIGGASINDRETGHEFVASILDWFHEGWPRIDALGISIVSADVPSINFDDLMEDEMEVAP